MITIGILAAQLQAGRLQVTAGQLADLAAHLAGAGEADLLHGALGERPLQPLERLGPVGEDDVEHPVRQPGGHEDPVEGVRRGRGVLGGLPHHRVAAQQRRHQVPRRHRHREVARGDHRRHPDRVAEGEQVLVRHLRRHRLAVQPAPLTQEEVARVDDLPHLTQRLGVRLADLPRHQPGQALGVGLDQPPDRRDHPPAHRRGNLGPLPLRVLGGTARVGERAGVGQPHLGHDLAGASGIDGRVRARTGGILATHDGNNLSGHR